MIIKTVKLRNFRNYKYSEFEFNKGLNFITGNNAQGKTNLLESLVYLSITRSHRILDDKKLIKDGEMFADIKCSFIDEDKMKDIETIIHPKGKTLMVHHQPVKKSSDFVGLLNVVLFSPDDLTIFSDAPKERRKIINQEISKISNKYLSALSNFQNLLKERNLLLKQYSVNQILLDTLDEKISEYELVIIQHRKIFIEMIDSYITAIYHKLSEDITDVHVKYKSCIENEISYESILKAHKENRQRDIENHVTSFGIHREDILFEMNGKPLIECSSQGQKRMTVLSFKISLLKYIQKETGKLPVLLLDDVLSELDHQRQIKLIEMVGNEYQCIITSTDIPSFLRNKEMKIFQIENGNLINTTGGKA
jgi:DNA replication and repair protein RecF